MSHTSLPPSPRQAVSLRPYPYPYAAALAICSDIDETVTLEHFLEAQRYLNTQEQTTLGPGLGLEIGNSFYFYDDERHFSYFTHSERAREVIRELVRTGYLDCLHTFGDAATEQDQIRRALDEVADWGSALDVWVNHNGSPSNLSSRFAGLLDRSPCLGDDPSSAVYHARATLAQGIRFAWLGAVTRIVGQSTVQPTQAGPASIGTAFDRHYPVATALSVVKEVRKSLLGIASDERYVLHHRNELIAPTILADGSRVLEFLRYCDHPQGVATGATAPGLDYVLSERVLARLIRRRGYMVVYTHLGKTGGSRNVFPPKAVVALQRLQSAFHEGDILVTTTSRLLNYKQNHDHVVWSSRSTPGGIHIDISHIDDPIAGLLKVSASALRGLTFYVPTGVRSTVSLQGVDLDGLTRNPDDGLGGESVSVPWLPLEYPGL